MHVSPQIEVRKVAKLKWLYNTINAILFSMWGLTIIDLIVIATNGGIFNKIDNWVKVLFTLAGLIYFIWKMLIELPHKKRMLRLDFEKRKLEVEQMKKGALKETPLDNQSK